jgi:hypothetical protein
VFLLQGLHAQKGVLRCPNHDCALQLGSWNWHGSNCSCGMKVSPAFIVVSGLTRCRERPPTAESQSDLQAKAREEVR